MMHGKGHVQGMQNSHPHMKNVGTPKMMTDTREPDMGKATKSGPSMPKRPMKG